MGAGQRCQVFGGIGGRGRWGDEKGTALRRGEKSKRGRKGRGAERMKALLLLVLPWLSPANYTDNLGNLHILYSEL